MSECWGGEEGLGNLLWCHRNRYTDGVDDVSWWADLVEKKQLERRGIWAGRGRMKEMKLVSLQLGTPPSISFSSDSELLIKSDSDGIYF